MAASRGRSPRRPLEALSGGNECRSEGARCRPRSANCRTDQREIPNELKPRIVISHMPQMRARYLPRSIDQNTFRF
ncbi:unnamed protein product, partial [Iphiclides podalirius]